MTQNPKVSVLLSIYKVDTYLAECLDSLLAQSYTNLEIVCVDNGSPDKCGEILKEYAQKDKRIKVITLPENRKLCGGRNVGLDNATGDYICFVDPDDWVEKDHIKVMVDAAENLKDSEGQPYNLILNYNAINFMVRSDNTIKELHIFDKQPGEKTIADFNLNARIETDIPMWGRLYRKSFLDQHQDVRFLEGFNTDNIPYTIKLLAQMKRWYCIKGEENATYWRRLITLDGAVTVDVLWKNLEMPSCLDDLFEYLKKYQLERKVKVNFAFMFNLCFPRHADRPRYYLAYKQFMHKMEDTIKSSAIYSQEDKELCNLLLYTNSFYEFIDRYFKPLLPTARYTVKTKLFGFIPFVYQRHFEDKCYYDLFKCPFLKWTNQGKKQTWYLLHCIPLLVIKR